MSKIDEIINSFIFESRSQQRHRDDDRFQDTRDLIAAALADARREGAEEMREAAAVAALGNCPIGATSSAEERAIRALPLPTGSQS